MKSPLKSPSIKSFKHGDSFDDPDKDNKSVRQMEAVWKGIQQSYKKFLTMKSYIIQCCDSYLNMVDRTDTLARQCMAAMLEKEKGAKDANYKTGFGATSSSKISSNSSRTSRMDSISTSCSKSII